MGIVGAVLVIGGDVAGIQASLDLADARFKVYLLDQSPSIGGRMAQLDKTFPTNDCATHFAVGHMPLEVNIYDHNRESLKTLRR